MKIMTYNLHSCIDMKKKNSFHRVVRLINREETSIVGLNEVETHTPRIGFTHQPRRLAEACNMKYCYGSTIRLGPVGFFGNAILTHYPIAEYRNIPLPSKLEPRCCLWTKLRHPQGNISILATHLGLNLKDREAQIAELRYLVSTDQDPLVLMGDFNCGPDELAPLCEVLTDAGSLFGSQPTYPSDKPTHRIDYIFLSRSLTCKNLYIPFTGASDHLPVIAELEVPF